MKFFKNLTQHLNYYKLQISAFFLFSNFRKRQIALYSPGWSVGRLVGRSVDVTINFFQYIQALQPFIDPVPLNTTQNHVIMTQYHQVPTSTASYWPSTTKYHPVPPFFDPVPSYINVPRDNVLCNNVPYNIVPCNIVPRDIFYNRPKQKKRIIIQIRDMHCLLGLVLKVFCVKYFAKMCLVSGITLLMSSK